jgi:hypothetical protein
MEELKTWTAMSLCLREDLNSRCLTTARDSSAVRTSQRSINDIGCPQKVFISLWKGLRRTHQGLDGAMIFASASSMRRTVPPSRSVGMSTRAADGPSPLVIFDRSEITARLAYHVRTGASAAAEVTNKTLTGYAESDASRALAAGFDYHLTKHYLSTNSTQSCESECADASCEGGCRPP